MLRRLRASLRDWLIAAGAARGVTIVPTWRANRLPMATHLAKLFAMLDIDCVLDVGANLGQYRDFLRDEVRYHGRIISFEPIPEHAAALRARSAQDPLWEVHGVALGAAQGTASFNVMASTEFSSFLQPDHDDLDIFSRDNTVARAIDVEVATVDSVLARVREAGPVRGIYLKLDTQGFDLDVLRGATLSLPAISALQTEASVRRIYADAPHFSDAIRTIEAMGFTLSGIFPNNDGHFPLLVEFDCVFLSNGHRT